ncbi:O-antigen ligase family protein [Erythrobacter litoralis]|uniref:O-antigen ligase family protein n=1 Tax=Erythrobacter litoralis TaxID=39960 RepID=UPI002434E5BD|nr:O-antigen ligase family protein [Erythrobacter litoralis]MDG6079618.1 O-antigen ligase family protein [Erythrobacter litoralis]
MQLTALGLICFIPQVLSNFRERASIVLVALIGLTILLPAIQLIPLPAPVWQNLPGRDLVAATFGVLGDMDRAFPISVDRARTITAALALLAPLTAIILTNAGNRRDGRAVLLAIVGLTMLNFAFGALQFAADGLYLYSDLTDRRFFGFFASHNTSGLFMVIGLIALVGYDRMSHAKLGVRLTHLLCALLLIIAVVLTKSRSSTALLLVPLGMFALYSLLDMRSASKRVRLIFVGGLTALIATGAILATTNSQLGETWQRYTDLEDSRPDIWEDTLYGIDRYWPVGSGMGTFDEVFQVEESLEALIAARAGRAHNEYLELALEAGVAGLALVAAWAIFLVLCWWRRRSGDQAVPATVAALSLLAIAAQGLVDYPMRNMALLTVAGLLVALLTAQPARKRDRVSV